MTPCWPRPPHQWAPLGLVVDVLGRYGISLLLSHLHSAHHCLHVTLHRGHQACLRWEYWLATCEWWLVAGVVHAMADVLLDGEVVTEWLAALDWLGGGHRSWAGGRNLWSMGLGCGQRMMMVVPAGCVDLGYRQGARRGLWWSSC